jgi:hypothetical protein
MEEKLMRVLRVIFGALALTAMLMPSARADEWNKQTFLTFSGPVQVPGATLTGRSCTRRFSRSPINVSSRATSLS